VQQQQPADTTVALSPSTDETEPTLEHSIGVLVASVAALLADGLCERQQGALTTRTKRAGGDAVFELYKLRQFMIADWPFDDVARKYGKRVLLESGGAGVDATTAEILVDGVLDILRKVVRAALN
jgi:hypothetical protein